VFLITFLSEKTFPPDLSFVTRLFSSCYGHSPLLSPLFSSKSFFLQSRHVLVLYGLGTSQMFDLFGSFFPIPILILPIGASIPSSGIFSWDPPPGLVVSPLCKEKAPLPRGPFFLFLPVFHPCIRNVFFPPFSRRKITVTHLTGPMVKTFTVPPVIPASFFHLRSPASRRPPSFSAAFHSLFVPPPSRDP